MRSIHNIEAFGYGPNRTITPLLFLLLVWSTACVPTSPKPDQGELCYEYEGTLAIPNQLFPNKDILMDPDGVPLDWNYPDSCLPEYYILQLAFDPEFTQIVVEDQLTGENSYWFPADQPSEGVEYFWHVAAEVGSTRTAFSETASFIMGPVCDTEQTLIAVEPAEGEIVTSILPTFRWENSGVCAQLIKHVRIEIAGREPECIHARTLQWMPSTPLSDCTEYQWLFGYQILTEPSPSSGGVPEPPLFTCGIQQEPQSHTFFVDLSGVCEMDVVEDVPSDSRESFQSIVEILQESTCLIHSEEGYPAALVIKTYDPGSEDGGWDHWLFADQIYSLHKANMTAIQEIIDRFGEDDLDPSLQSRLQTLFEEFKNVLKHDSPSEQETLGGLGEDWINVIPVCPLSKTFVFLDVETNCRSGPGKKYPKRDPVRAGEFTEVVGRHEAWDFLYVKSLRNQGEYCWIWGEYAHVLGDLSQQPIVVPEPPSVDEPDKPLPDQPPGPSPTCEPGKPCG